MSLLQTEALPKGKMHHLKFVTTLFTHIQHYYTFKMNAH